ncbi:hypothetical protein NL376_27740, partial [Klebsiella pneumoniae]|nr:hypothetical protein [Klebsiella pneumoniae]
DRARRRGYPEAVFCKGKTPARVAAIAARFAETGDTTVFTRASPEHAEAVLSVLPDAFHDPLARMLAYPAEPPAPAGKSVMV